MTAALLFAATFFAVWTLGIQQINVERRMLVAAAVTSPLIGLAHLALFKVLPGPTDALEIAAYLAGGSAGIVASIWAHPRLVAWWAGCMRVPAAASSSAATQRAERLGETLRLATQIADESARSDIECRCSRVHMGANTWYDTRCLHDRDELEIVDVALRYLRLRDSVAVHPTQHYLVRFEA